MTGRPRQFDWPRLCTLFLAATLIALSPGANAENSVFRITNAATRALDGVYRLDADIEYNLPPEPLEALENGVPIAFELVIRVVRKRPWLPDEAVATLLQQYRLKYHSLTELYLVTNLNSGERRSYPTMRSALREMGKVRNLPIIDIGLLESGQDYQVELKVGLDIEALPAPLRLLAYLSSDWWTSSEWVKWQL